MAAFFHSYDNNSYQLAKNNTENRASKFLSTYEHEIISIASQPTFRNLLGADQNMLKSMDITNPF